MQRKLWFVLLISFSLLAVWGTLAAQGTPQSQPAPVVTPTRLSESPLRQEVSQGIESPDTSLIESPSPTCFRPVERTGVCYIAWNYMYVTAEPGQYVISMTVSIDNSLRAYQAGFFQSSMYIPGDMYGPGFKMTCGMPGSGVVPGLGNTYSYAIKARDTGGLGSSNSGFVTCPADPVTVYLPITRKH